MTPAEAAAAFARRGRPGAPGVSPDDWRAELEGRAVVLVAAEQNPEPKVAALIDALKMAREAAEEAAEWAEAGRRAKTAEHDAVRRVALYMAEAGRLGASF